MKIKLSTNRLVNITVITFVVFFTAIFFLEFGFLSGTFNYSSQDGEIIYQLSDSLKPIDSIPPANLSYNKYISVRDSIKNIRNFKNENIFNTGGFQFGYVAGTTGSYILCDTCTINGYWTEVKNSRKSASTQYYLKLPGWRLKSTANNNFYDDSVRFYQDHNKAYVRKIIIYKAVKSKNGSITNYTHFVDIPVKFGYDQQGQSLLIPITRSAKNIVNIILITLIIALIAYMFYLLAAFLKFLVDLSKGFSFTEANIKRLRLIAISLLIYPIVMILLAFLMRLVFYSYFTHDVIINSDVWNTSWKPFCAGITFLLLYRSFRQGKKLKDEQELTV